MSAGSLFTYVESKEALFHLACLYGLGLLPEQPEALPLASPGPGETVALLRRALQELPMPRLRAALHEDDPADVAGELRGIVEELYDLTERYWPVFTIIERCAVEIPELETLWFGDTGGGGHVGLAKRGGRHAGLTKYVERRMATGRLRPMPNVAIATRVVVESVAWFAWHRHQSRDSALYDDQTARHTVVEFACAALIPESAPISAQSLPDGAPSPRHDRNGGAAARVRRDRPSPGR
jgi:AcrR family transcriptional regulator